MNEPLLEAYLNTVFCVFNCGQTIDIKIGEANSALSELMRECGVVTAAFITASNPASRILSDEQNRDRNKALLADVGRLGFACLKGEGRDPNGEWVPEQSLLILGIDEVAASALAVKYGQNAYVDLAAGDVARLIFPSDD